MDLSVFRKFWWVWVLVCVIFGVSFFVIAMFPPSFYLPHQKPVLILPIEAKYDSHCGLMPMGEKIYHPDAPSGHPGIDFGLDNLSENVPYIASMDGTISKVEITDNPDFGKNSGSISQKIADVIIQNGPYQTRYAEMDANTLPDYIKVGKVMKQGDVVGYGNFKTNPQDPGMKSEMIHWEFGSTSPIIDRFCPLTYFTNESRIRIENIWAKTVWQGKDQYPKICNGDYDGKAEK